MNENENYCMNIIKGYDLEFKVVLCLSFDVLIKYGLYLVYMLLYNNIIFYVNVINIDYV